LYDKDIELGVTIPSPFLVVKDTVTSFGLPVNSAKFGDTETYTFKGYYIL